MSKNKHMPEHKRLVTACALPKKKAEKKKKSRMVKSLPIFKRDWALWKMVFVLYGQAFGYAHGICVAFDTCCSGANL